MHSAVTGRLKCTRETLCQRRDKSTIAHHRVRSIYTGCDDKKGSLEIKPMLQTWVGTSQNMWIRELALQESFLSVSQLRANDTFSIHLSIFTEQYKIQ